MTTTPTPAQVEAFKTAWHRADIEGREGERVRAGLAAAMAADSVSPGDLSASDLNVNPNWQGIIYFPADGAPLVMDDNDQQVPELVADMPAVARAVTVARLRAWADLLAGDLA